MRAETNPLITADDCALRVVAALARGEPVVLRQGEAAAAAISVEMLSEPRLRAAIARFGPEFDVAITHRRAATLKARPYDGDIARIIAPPDATFRVIRSIADPTLALTAPMTGPHRTRRDGDASLARAAIGLCRRARLLPAALVWTLPAAQSVDLAASEALSIADAATLERLRSAPSAEWREVASAQVPIAASSETTLRLFRRLGGDDEHYVVEVGDARRPGPVLARLHSACATGDIFGSLKCDCGPQLAAAIAAMGAAGGGVLVYLQQEGRGIGLANKLRAYRLQEDGFDTVEANHRLGFDDDERILADGGQILRALGFQSVRLMTNNPAKIASVEAEGLEVVERAPLQVGLNGLNADYLRTKADKSGHLL